MPKRFNDTGLCIPEKHYMVDISPKIQAIFKLVIFDFTSKKEQVWKQEIIKVEGKEIFTVWV